MPIPLPSRGYKTVLRFFPNDVPSFEPVVALLTHIDAVQQRQRGPAAEALRLGDGAGLWEAQVGPAGSGFRLAVSCTCQAATWWRQLPSGRMPLARLPERELLRLPASLLPTG